LHAVPGLVDVDAEDISAVDLIDAATGSALAVDGGLEEAIVGLDVGVGVGGIAIGEMAEVQGVEGWGTDAADAGGEGVGDFEVLQEWRDVIDHAIFGGAALEHARLNVW